MPSDPTNETTTTTPASRHLYLIEGPSEHADLIRKLLWRLHDDDSPTLSPIEFDDVDYWTVLAMADRSHEDDSGSGTCSDGVRVAYEPPGRRWPPSWPSRSRRRWTL